MGSHVQEGPISCPLSSKEGLTWAHLSLGLLVPCWVYDRPAVHCLSVPVRRGWEDTP